MHYISNMKLVRLSVTVMLVLLSAVGTALSVAADTTKKSYVADEYIIKVRTGASLDQVQAGVAKIGGQLLRALPVKDTYLIKLTGKSNSKAVFKASGLSRSNTSSTWLIKAIQPNYVYYPTAEPNDALWSEQWDKIGMNMPKVWDSVKGAPGVFVAVLDTGVAYDHPDLEDRAISALGYDYADDDDDPNDEEGHGTHVAGIIAAQGDNGIGTVGMCWDNVAIIPIRVLGLDGGTSEMIINGLDHAKSRGAQVVNMSLGGLFEDLAQQAKIQELVNDNILVVCAAGNSGDESSPSLRRVNWPAAFPESLAVASTGKNDKIAYYSSYGPDNEVDITAPGGDQMENYSYSDGILSTFVNITRDDDGVVTARQNGWTYLQGTSMACPQVAGGAALLLSAGIPETDLRSLLENTTRLPSRNYDPVKFGKGIMDIQAALAGSVVRIIAPTAGASTVSNPKIQVRLLAIRMDSVSVQMDGVDIIEAGEADEYADSTVGGISFTLPLPGGTALSPGTHTLSVSGMSLLDGKLMFDESKFTVAKTPVESGIYLFAFPYMISASTEGPSTILPGTTFSWSAPNKSRLIKWIAAPQSGVAGTQQYGYVNYNPDSIVDLVWKNTSVSLGGASWFVNGGYYSSSESILGTVSHPTVGSGYWLVVPSDTYVKEDLPSLEGEEHFDPSKGYMIPLYNGWNIIGNPFPKKVSWQTCLFRYRGETKGLLSAVDAGWLNAVAYGYDSTISRDYRRVTSRDSLEAFRGYWVRSYVGDRNNPLELIVLP